MSKGQQMDAPGPHGPSAEIELANVEFENKRLRAALAQAQAEIARLKGEIDTLDELHKEKRVRLAAMEQQLHDAKTQCGKNAISHMTQYHRADDLQQQLATAHEQQERLREALRTVLKHLNTCLDDRDIDPDGPIGELYGMMHEWEDLVAQATPSGDA